MDKNRLPIEKLKDKISPEILAWLRFINDHSVLPPKNPEIILESAQEAKTFGCSLPLILSICPAFRNLEKPTLVGQTRELISLEKGIPRLESFFSEFFDFIVLTKEEFGISPEFFLIFADILEPEAIRRVTNARQMDQISKQSTETIQQFFLMFDQENRMFFRRTGLRIPKIWLQSKIIGEAKKIGFDQKRLLFDFAKASFDPDSPAFDLFVQHLRIRKKDLSLAATAWQSLESSEIVWKRSRFSTAQCAVDGLILPAVLENLWKNRFPQKIPRPIFIASESNPAEISLEMEGFNFASRHPEVLKITGNEIGVAAPFFNIGHWSSQTSPSSFIEAKK